MKLRIFSLSLFLLAVLPSSGQTDGASRNITTPKQAFGFNIGDDYMLVNYTQATAYIKKLATESDRKIVRSVVKAGRSQGAQIASRIIPVAEADAWANRLASLEDDVTAVLEEEKTERALGVAERELRKGENLVVHADEIAARPKRTWFESEKAKTEARDKGRVELNGEIVLGKKGKAKLSNKEKKRLALKDERKEAQAWKKGKGDAVEARRKPMAGKAGKAGKAGGKTKGKDGSKARGASKTRGKSRPRGGAR